VICQRTILNRAKNHCQYSIFREKSFLFTNYLLHRIPAKRHCSLKEQKKSFTNSNVLGSCLLQDENFSEPVVFAARIFLETHLLKSSVAEPEPKAEEPKLNCLPEPELKLRIAALATAPAPAPAHFYLQQH
jgi:hypothetical protein